MLKQMSKFAAGAFAIILLLIPKQSRALSFNPNFIISDSDLIDSSTMTEDEIQTFLFSKGSYLAFYSEKVNGKQKSAARIIHEAANAYSINPQFLLTLLQKEQSLIEDPNPKRDQLDWAAGFGVCDSCSKDDPALKELKGFTTQVFAAAEKIRLNYLRDLDEKGSTLSGWGPGITKFTVEGVEITPANKATSVLYTYNPYQGNTQINGRLVGANFNFWKIWQRFFAKLYPDGTLAQDAKTGAIYLIQYGKKRLFKSMSVFLSSFSPGRIIKVDPQDLKKYRDDQIIKFAQYSLLRSPKGAVFLLSDDKLRPIKSREVFRTLGFNPEEVINVKEKDFKDFKIGEEITFKTSYPQGALLQNKKTGAVFYVQNGVKYGIADKSIMLQNFPNKKIIKVNAKELEKYDDGGPIVLKDGLLIKGESFDAVYVVSQSLLRPIASAQAFEKLGYKWENVIKMPDKVIAMHKRGEVIDVILEEENFDFTQSGSLE